MLFDLYKSLEESCGLSYELIVGMDLDDKTGSRYNRLFDKVDNISLVYTKRCNNLHTKMNNLFSLTKGKYIFVLNDDCLVVNKHWDLSAKESLDSFGDIVYGRTYDDSIDRVDSSYSAFPIVSRLAVEKLGFVMDETFGNHGSDVITYRIYDNAEFVVDLPEVKVSHLFHNSQSALMKRNNDNTAKDMIGRTFSDYTFSVQNLFNHPVTEMSMRLRK